jgi:hypothetical protein
LSVLTLAAIALVAPGVARATLSYNDNVTSNVIFGAGNANGGFTVDRTAGVELGLRGKLRFDANNLPQNTFNYTGVSGAGHGVYTFAGGGVDPMNGPLPGWADATTPVWNFEWSVNVNYDGSALGRGLDDLTYALFVDFNPAALDVPAVIFDPINVSFADHSIGDSATAGGAGVEATSAPNYAALIAANSMAQNSWSMEFFDAPASPYPFNPNTAGTYTIRLDAYDGINLVSSASIDVTVAVPEISAFMFGGLICGVLGLWSLRQRRRREAAII